jgi:prephenate dehydratase
VVIEAIHALARHVVSIEKLFEIVVKQNLLVFPGTKREDITAVTSHDQAIKQCRMYVKRMFPHADVKEYPDTAQAAKDLGEGVLPPSTAIIAPLSCAQLYNLDVLEENINDLKFNVTNFMVIVK